MYGKEGLNLKLMRLIFIINLVVLGVFIFLFVTSSNANFKLKAALLQLEKSRVSLSQSLQKQAIDLQNERKKWEEGAASFLEWRYVLRDQVNYAQQRIAAQMDKTKKDKPLMNTVYYTLGLTYILAVDFQPAINAFEEAVKFDPEDAFSYYDLGMLYSTYKNDSKKAIENYKKYLGLAAATDANQARIVQERIKALEAK